MSAFILTILSVFLISDLLWWWFAHRRFRLPTPQHRRRRRVIAFIGTLAILSLAWIVFARVSDIPLDAYTPRILVIFTLVWHLLALPLAWAIMLLHGTSRIGSAIFSAAAKTKPASEPLASIDVVDSPPPAAPSRREFLAQLGAFAPVAVAGAASGYSAVTLSSFRIREISVPIPNLPSAIDGLTIAHVSDTHLGRFTDERAFRAIVSAVNDLDADLVLHTGDIINDDQALIPLANQLIREMKARRGTYLCEGNHDLIGGRESFESAMRAERMPILIDEIRGVEINRQRVELLGLRWTRGGRTSGTDGVIAEGVTRLAARRSSSAFPILLAHHPHAFDPAVENGIPLTLGGHTHGGQLHLSPTIGFGPAMYRYWSGLYSREGCHTVISNGSGNWFPLRLNAPAEVARIVLRRA